MEWFESVGNFSWWNIYTRGGKKNIRMASRDGGTWKSSSSGKDVRRPKDCGELMLSCHPTFSCCGQMLLEIICLILSFDVTFLSSSQTYDLYGSTTILVFSFSSLRIMRHLTDVIFIFGSFHFCDVHKINSIKMKVHTGQQWTFFFFKKCLLCHRWMLEW